MSASLENTYGNLQMEERYKKLERTLKMFILNQKKSLDIHSPDPTWPTVSSINDDPLDTSSTGFSVHSFRIGSDVLASSNNMRKMIRSTSQVPNKPQMTTSSIKHFPMKCEQAERVLMPPPQNVGILARPSQRNSLTPSGLPKSMVQSSSGKAHIKSAQSGISVIKCLSSEEGMSQIEYEKENYRDHQQTLEIKPDRIFSKWRPVLNDKGQLIIKGALECGKVARSKPVIRRLSSDAVQSAFNHIYYLRGNIHDERNELPEYIRGKFYNGFPDDWENVYQVWSKFVTAGSCHNFRWPTPITDSDDDLNSEITDVSDICKSRCVTSTWDLTVAEDIRLSAEKQLASSKPRKETLPDEILHNNNSLSSCKYLNTSKLRRHCCPDGWFDTEKLPKDKSLNLRVNLRSPEPSNSKSSFRQRKSCVTKFNVRDYGTEDSNKTIDNCQQLRNSQMNTSASLTPSIVSKLSMTSLKDIIQEDKLKIILDNLKSKTCSVEYFDKMLELFDCLKYIMSYQSNDPAPETPAPESPEPCKATSGHRETVKFNAYFQEALQSSLRPSNSQEAIHKSQTHKRNVSVKRKLSKVDYDTSDDYSEDEGRLRVATCSVRRGEKPLERLRSTEKKHHPDLPVSGSEKRVTPVTKMVQTYPPEFNPPTLNEHKTLMKLFRMPGKPLVNYDSSISFTEDEHIPLQSPLQLLKARRKVRGLQPKHDDSTISLTENEIGHNVQTRAKAKRPIIHEANAEVKSTEDSIKRWNSKGTHQQQVRSISEKMEKVEQYDSKTGEDKCISVLSFYNNSICNITEEITNQSGEHHSPEKVTVKSKPTIFNIENVSVTLPPQILTRPSSQCFDEGQFLPTKDSLDPLKPMAVDIHEDLRVKLQDVLKNKESQKIPLPKLVEDSEKEKFGAESNPKILTAWVPKLLRTSAGDYRLIFEGKLLNEVGHVVSRRFSTDVILRRVNPQVVETVAHEFYQLTGDLTDTKHAVPKEVQKMCLKGCPLRINMFCEKWRKLIDRQSSKDNENHSTSIDMVGIPTSSRGRRILPPLCYWTGERVTLKDNTPVYSPGNTQESSIPSSLEMSFRKERSQSSSRRKETSAEDPSISSTLINSSDKHNARSLEEKQQKRTEQNNVKNDSSDSEAPEIGLRVKRRRGRRGEDKPIIKEREKRSVDSKNRKVETASARIFESGAQGVHSENIKEQSSGLTYTYRMSVPCHDDVLSDDQLSTM